MKKEPVKKERVVVAMSGGVDSSVVAAMLKDQNYEVIGVTMQLYDYGATANKKQKTCCASKDINDASIVAQKINIPHYVLNYESRFKEQVIDKFVESYLQGYTPIPCVSCNQSVKFNDLYNFAKKLGAKFLATGHYVNKIIASDGTAQLHKGAEEQKDQSYFLYATTQEQLNYCEFPLGMQTKDQTRQLAVKYGLAVASKPDSQDICFVPEGDYFAVVKKHSSVEIKSGDIIEIESGKKIGIHEGIAKYTIGQRRGLGVSSAEPLFVVKLDPNTNTVYAGSVKYLYKKRFLIEDINFLCNSAAFAAEGKVVELKLRSIQREQVFGLIKQSGIEGQYIVELINPTRAITPGQACVFYENSQVLGGGIIRKILD